MPACARCGSTNALRARFCSSCGRPLTIDRFDQGHGRRDVSVLFADLVDSTSLVRELGPEGFRKLQQIYFPRVRECIEGHGGIVEKYIGDAVMAVFGILDEEQHADQATRAALDILELVDSLSEEPDDTLTVAARIGIDSGTVSISDATAGQLIATGDLVIRAARLQQTGPPNRAVISEATKEALRGEYLIDSTHGNPSTFLVERRIKPDFRPRRHPPFVGRDSELGFLKDRADEAFHSHSLRCVVIHGPAGVGKSRLGQELSRSLPHVRAVWGRCLPYGSGDIGWFPIADMLDDLERAHENEPAEAIADRIDRLKTMTGGEFATDSLLRLFGYTENPPGPEGAWTFAQTIRALSRQEPVILFFQDCQWALPPAVQAILSLRETQADLPLLIVCISREVSFASRIGVATSDELGLAPLVTPDITGLASEMVGNDAEGESIIGRLAEASEGNPLTLEECMWLRSQTSTWAQVLSLLPQGEGPVSPRQIVDLRLTFCADQRDVLEKAAVRGRIFWRGDVIESDSPEEIADCNRALAALVDKGILRFAFELGDDWFSFRHLLIAEQAYKGIEEGRRRELHQRCGQRLMQTFSEDQWLSRSMAQYHLDRATGLEDPPRFVNSAPTN